MLISHLIRRYFGVVLLVMLTVVAFQLPNRFARGWTYMPEVEWVTPSKRIVDEVLVVAYANINSYISYYDELFREASTPYGHDWRLMSAIAYVESRFKPHAISYSGAVGLMQIMPRIGRSFGFTPMELLDPEINVRVANMLVLNIESMLSLPSNITLRDKYSLILASYNGGIGHVFDAQRIARRQGGDPHVWSNVVSPLLQLRDSAVYNSELVRFGSFHTAGHTVAYVRDVMRKFDEYSERTAGSSAHLYPYARRYEEKLLSL